MTTSLLGTNKVYLCVLHKTFKQTAIRGKSSKPHTTFRNDLTASFTFKIQPDYLEIYRIKLSEAVNFVAAWKMVNYKLKRWVTLFLFSFRSKTNHENKLAPEYWVTDDSNWHTKERIKATNLSQTFSWGNFFRWTACYEIMKFFMDNSL